MKFPSPDLRLIAIFGQNLPYFPIKSDLFYPTSDFFEIKKKSIFTCGEPPTGLGTLNVFLVVVVVVVVNLVVVVVKKFKNDHFRK